MDSSKLARILFAVESEFYKDSILNEIDISTHYPDDLQIPEAGYNCLHLSVMKEDVQLTKKLLDQGADLMKQGSRNGHTPLHVFVKSKLFNEKQKINQLIGKLENQQIIDILLNEQIKRHDALNPKCFFGVTHLHIACMVDHLQAIEFFLKAGESVNQVINANSTLFAGWAPLHIAITYSSIATVFLLFYYGADIHLKDALGTSPLHRLLKRQLDAMDNINMGKRAIVTLIIREVKRLEMIICALLKSRKMKEVNFIDEAGISALHVACTIRNPFIAKDFLKGDVDINKSLNNKLMRWAGWTPLHFAACCSVETVKLLVKHGADVTIKNTEGETPLDFCMRRYSPEVIHSILSIKDKFKDIVLSDESTKLLDLILAMDDCGEFYSFLQNLTDINVIVPHDSPIWPGYSIFHLAISMHERTLDPADYVKQLSNQEIFPKQYTCLEMEEKIYWKRIAVCLARQCSLSTKDFYGMTPVHLAFKLRKANVVDKLLNCCRTNNETDPHGLSFLHMACAVGKKNVVERFINVIENPVGSYFQWYREEDSLMTLQANSTALHVAVAFNHREIVEYLLQNKANVYAQDSLGSTPIHLSAFSQPIACLLLGKIINVKEVVSRNSLSHLHVAAFADDDTAIAKLVNNGANVNIISKTNIPHGKIDYLDQTPLHIAVKMENLKAVRALIEAGADIHATGWQSNYDTPLQGAMRMESNEMTDEFVKKLRREKQTKGAIEACNVTLLHFACAVFDFKWAEKLLDKGADPNAQVCMVENFKCEWKGYSPLHLLLIRAHFATKKLKNLMDMVRLLLKHGADVTLQDVEGQSPLLLAEKLAHNEASIEERKKENVEMECKKTSGEEKGKKKKKKKNEKIAKDENFELNDKEINGYLIADLLLKHQKSYAINPMNHQGASHFHYACKRNKVGIVGKFLKNGVDVNQALDIFLKSNNAGFTPLHFALVSQSFEVAELLLQHNANVKAKDILDHTPLHVAAANNVDDVGLLETMWRMGADIKAENVYNATPLDLLIQSDFISSDELKFFFERGSLIEFDEKDAYKGVIGKLLRNARPDDREAILRLLFDYCNLAEQIKNGFNAIHSFVSIPPDPSNWTVDRYLGGILFFMDMGCDIDRQTCFGITASHSAVFYNNPQAVEALLLLGANINISHEDLKSPFPYSDLKPSTEPYVEWYRMCTVLGSHVWKMKFMGLDVDEEAMKIAENFWNSGNINIKLEDRCKEELEKMAHMKIGEKWTMKDFLSNSKIVIEYQTLSLSQRQSIDEIFKSHANLRKMFPEFCGLLMLQYRKAVSYVKLYWTVKNAIVSMIRYEFPDEYLKEMLKYFDKVYKT